MSFDVVSNAGNILILYMVFLYKLNISFSQGFFLFLQLCEEKVLLYKTDLPAKSFYKVKHLLWALFSRISRYKTSTTLPESFTLAQKTR